MLEENALSTLKKDLLEDPKNFAANAEKYDLEYEIIPDLQEYLRDKSVEDKFTAWSDLVGLLPHFKKLIYNQREPMSQGAEHDVFSAVSVSQAARNQINEEGEDTNNPVQEMANCIAINALHQFKKIIPNNDMPIERLGHLLNDVRTTAFFVNDERDCKYLFSEVLGALNKRAPELARVPENGHCVWLSGRSGTGNARNTIPLDGIIHMAKYAHLHPGGVVSLWTDDVHSIEKSKCSLENLLRGVTLHMDDSYESINNALSDTKMTRHEALEGLKRIHIKKWEQIFSNNQIDLSESKRKLLESTVISDTNSAAPLRSPASAKEIIFMAALAIMGGGVAFDLDVLFKKKLEIFDYFGIQYMAEELPPGGPLDFSSKPAVIAAASKSQTAMKALEKMADFLQENGVNKRFGTMDRPNYQGPYANSRYRLTMRFAEQPAHAIRDEFGNGCYRRFDDLNQLSMLDGIAFAIPAPLHRNVQVIRSQLRRASDPPLMGSSMLDSLTAPSPTSASETPVIAGTSREISPSGGVNGSSRGSSPQVIAKETGQKRGLERDRVVSR